MRTSPRGGRRHPLDETAAEYLACLAKLRADPLDPEALFALAALYAEEGHRKHAVWYLRKVEFLDRGHPGLTRLKNRLRRWKGLNGARLDSPQPARKDQ